MAHKKSSKVSSVSNGGRQKANVAHEQVRQARFARRKEAGKTYEYKPIPYEKETPEFLEEQYKRAEKVRKTVENRTDYARLTSFFAKLDNKLNAEKLKQKESTQKSR